MNNSSNEHINWFITFQTRFLEEPNENDQIQPGLLRSLCGNDRVNTLDLISSPYKDAVDSFCTKFIRIVDTNYYFLVDTAYEQFIEKNPSLVETNKITFEMILRDIYGPLTFQNKGWKGLQLISSNE